MTGMRRALLLVALVGCGSEDVLVARALPTSIAGPASAVVAANNAFACDLYGAVRAGAAPNVILSPFSIATALSMVAAGTTGATEAQLRTALHATLDRDATGAAYRALLASLTTGTGYGGYTLQIADRLFGQRGAAFVPEFLAITRDDYGAELMPVDFGAPAATDAIDSWVADATSGHIPMLFAPGALGSSTRLVLANAIHFAGGWQTAFDTAAPGRFVRADGTAVTAPMMTKHAMPIALRSIDGVGAIVALPFEGKDLAFVVVVPATPDGLAAVEAQLTAENLATWLAMPGFAPEAGVNITLPRFGITTAIDLAGTLGALGIVDAFDAARADFSPTDGARDLALEHVQHAAVITVDEHGAEADAATGVNTTVVIGPPTLSIDHPFLFLIRDAVTGAVLFIGRVGDPSLSAG